MPSGKHASPRLQVVLPEPLNTQLRERAEHEGRPLSELLRESAANYLETAPMKHFSVHCSNRSNFGIAGADLGAAILGNFATIAREHGIGNAAGYRLQGVHVEYRQGILGGTGGAELLITAQGTPLANGNSGQSKTTSVWIECRPEDCPAPFSIEIGSA